MGHRVESTASSLTGPACHSAKRKKAAPKSGFSLRNRAFPGYWIVIAQADVPVIPFASVTAREKEPEAVGVPVTVNVAEFVDVFDGFSVSPAGSVPTTEKV
jgi:hypothetical protein